MDKFKVKTKYDKKEIIKNVNLEKYSLIVHGPTLGLFENKVKTKDGTK